MWRKKYSVSEIISSIVLNMEKSITVSEMPQNLPSLFKARGTLWLVTLFLTLGVHLEDTGCHFLRAVLKWDHLTHVRWITMNPEQEEVGNWPNLHFQKVFWPLSKFTPIATSSSHQGDIGKSSPYQTTWRFIAIFSWTMSVCSSYVSITMRDTEETPKKEDLLQGVWLCPPRHNYQQLLWLKTEFKFCFIRLSDTLGKWFPSSLFQLEKKNGKDLNVLFTITFRKLENSGGFTVIEGQRAATPVAPWLFDPEIMNPLCFYNYLTEKVRRGRM